MKAPTNTTGRKTKGGTAGRQAAAVACALAVACGACASTTVRTRSGTVIHLANVAGRANVASVTADGASITGFGSDNGDSARKLLGTWGWMKFWTGPGGRAVTELSSGAVDVATKALR